jgi:SAM-dependent methyltransferase
MDASLYNRPELYDLISPPDPEMERFYVDLARERGGRILELACGTGRFTIPLAQAGLDVTAGDLSDTMLAAARAAAERTGVDNQFHQIDMRDFDLGATFDTIIVTTNSVLHLHSADDLSRFFATVTRHLAPQGQLVFDAFVPSIALLSRSPDTRERLGQFGSGDEHVTVDETMRYDPITQVSHIEWIWSRTGAPDFWRHPLEMRQIFPQEMPVLVAAGGLRLLERFGDFDRSPLGPDSRRQVCICGR